MSISNLAKFTTELKQALTDIVELKRQPISSMFDRSFKELHEEEELVNLMGRLLKGKQKEVDKSVKKSRLE